MSDTFFSMSKISKFILFILLLICHFSYGIEDTFDKKYEQDWRFFVLFQSEKIDSLNLSNGIRSEILSDFSSGLSVQYQSSWGNNFYDDFSYKIIKRHYHNTGLLRISGTDQLTHHFRLGGFYKFFERISLKYALLYEQIPFVFPTSLSTNSIVSFFHLGGQIGANISLFHYNHHFLDFSLNYAHFLKSKIENEDGKNFFQYDVQLNYLTKFTEFSTFGILGEYHFIRQKTSQTEINTSELSIGVYILKNF